MGLHKLKVMLEWRIHGEYLPEQKTVDDLESEIKAA
jgi:hypothetical protein